MPAKQPLPNRVTKTVICVDEVDAFDFSGILCNPYMPGKVRFGQAKDAILCLDGFFDEISFPQSCFQCRAFDEKPRTDGSGNSPRRYIDSTTFESSHGKVATFEIEVRFRRSATWQGDFHWLEGSIKADFNSVLELLMLMDNALGMSCQPDSGSGSEDTSCSRSQSLQ